MPGKYFKKKGQSNKFKMTNPLKHFVDDYPEHQETYGDHSDDLQTDEEHESGEVKSKDKDKAPTKILGGEVTGYGAQSDTLSAWQKSPTPGMFFYKNKKKK